MTKTREYFLKWEKEGNNSDYSFFDNLNQSDWDDFWDDFLSGFHLYLRKIFENKTLDQIDEYILPFISNLSPKAHGLIDISLNSELKNALNHNELEKIPTLLNFLDYLEIKVSQRTLISVLNNKKLSKDSHIKAASLLNQSTEVKSWWDKVNLNKKKFLIPSFMMFFHNNYPYKSLEKFFSIHKRLPRNIAEYEIPVKNSLVSLLKYSSDANKFQNLLKLSPKWAKDYILEIINTYGDLEILKTKLFEENSNGLYRLRVGLGVYPDFVLIELLKNKGVFKSKGIDLEIKYYKWNRLFNHLDNNDVDIVITNNNMLYEKESENNNAYRELTSLNKYNGFAIVAKDLDLKSYETINKGNPEFNTNSLRETLIQIKGKRIFASKDTDHYIQLTQTISKSGLIPQDFKTLYRNMEPYIGVKYFLEGKCDVFVGGAIHTEILKSKNGNVILSAKGEDFGATQYNLFVCRKKNQLPDEIIKAFHSSLKDGKSHFSKENFQDIAELYTLFDSTLKKEYKNDYDLFEIKRNSFTRIVKDVIEYDFSKIKELTNKDRKYDMIYQFIQTEGLEDKYDEYINSPQTG